MPPSTNSSSPATYMRRGPPKSSSGHQDREFRLVHDRPCNATDNPLVQAGVTIGAHDDEIGAEIGGLRQQNTAYVLSVGRQAAYLHLHAGPRQVAPDIPPRLPSVTPPVALRGDRPHLDHLLPPPA